MTGRRRFGTTRELPSGRWQARYRDTDGVLRAAPSTFVRKSDAERWLVRVEADISRGAFTDHRAGKVTVGEWADRWLAAVSPQLKLKTRAGYESLLSTKIRPRFGEVPLSAVKPIAVREWVGELTRQGFSPSRVRQSYRLLSQIMSAAVENDLIAVSPCRGVRLPRMPESHPRILSEAEVDRLIAAVPPPHDVLVMLLAYAGLRIGEAFAVRRRSVDLERGSLVVSEAVVEISGHLSFDTPKSHQRRTVTLPDFVVERLSALLRSTPSSSSLLFPTSNGGPQHYNAWRKTYFDPAVTAVGLVGVTPHHLRASHATWTAERHGVMAAAARLGHANASVTTRHYARASAGIDRVVADELGSRRERRNAERCGTDVAREDSVHDPTDAEAR